jgi:hypothetical protein
LRANAHVDDTASVEGREQALAPRSGAVLRAGLGAGIVAAAIGAVFAWLGVVNGDEGWYALGARFVSQGRLPYRDFAFTQGPAYLYVLAPFVRLLPDVYTARAVSVVCTAVSIGLLIAAARRIGGKWTALVSCAALLATVPSLPYWLSITKTYSLACLFLSAVFFTLTSNTSPGVRYPVAAALAVGFAETRSTGFALAVVLVLALLVLSPDERTRVRVVLASAAAIFPVVVLVLLEWSRSSWGLLAYHHLGSHGSAGIGRYWSRSYAMAHSWPGPFLLGALALVAVLVNADIRATLRRRLDLVALVVGVVLFVFLHETAAQFFSEEYFAPVAAPVIVMSTIVLMRAASRVPRPTSGVFARLASGALAVGIVITAITGGHQYYLGAPGWGGSPAGLNEVVRCVQEFSKPHDTVFALSLEEVVLQAHRRPVPNVTLGPFSYEDVSTQRARQLKIINDVELATTFKNRPPRVAVLTVDDIFETHRAGYFSKKKVENNAWYFLFQRYKPVCKATLIRHVFKNVKESVTVYALPPDK